MWRLSHRADKRALPLADRHYNRQKIGSPQFVPPGKCFVLLATDADALWVTSWPIAAYVKHAWAGAWINSLFRNETHGIASEMILAAVAATRLAWSEVPPLGMVTFVDPKHVPAMVRRLPPPQRRRHVFEIEERKAIHGYCYLQAGFVHVGYTKGGLWTWQLAPEDMPPADAPNELACDIAAKF